MDKNIFVAHQYGQLFSLIAYFKKYLFIALKFNFKPSNRVELQIGFILKIELRFFDNDFLDLKNKQILTAGNDINTFI